MPQLEVEVVGEDEVIEVLGIVVVLGLGGAGELADVRVDGLRLDVADGGIVGVEDEVRATLDAGGGVLVAEVELIFPAEGFHRGGEEVLQRGAERKLRGRAGSIGGFGQVCQVGGDDGGEIGHGRYEGKARGMARAEGSGVLQHDILFQKGGGGWRFGERHSGGELRHPDGFRRVGRVGEMENYALDSRSRLNTVFLNAFSSMSRNKPKPGERPKKSSDVSLVRSLAAEYLTFVAASGAGGVDAVYADENVWLSQKMLGLLYDVETHTVTPSTTNSRP